jgi:hypothetical protein
MTAHRNMVERVTFVTGDTASRVRAFYDEIMTVAAPPNTAPTPVA